MQAVLRELTFDSTGVMLVDPTMTEGYPLWGGYGDAKNPPSLEEGSVALEIPAQSFYEAFIRWCTAIEPKAIATALSDPAFLMIHMAFAVLSDWLIVVEYAKTRLSHIEWELETERWRGPQGLDETLGKLQPWRRRLPVYLSFVKAAKFELECQRSLSSLPKEHWEDIMADVEEVYDRMKILQERVDQIINVATAVISIEDSKKAMQEARSVTRITYLAFVFVPMSFTTSFLSMTDFPVGTRVYWVFFVIALPLSTLAVLIAVNWATINRYLGGKKANR